MIGVENDKSAGVRAAAFNDGAYSTATEYAGVEIRKGGMEHDPPLRLACCACLPTG